MLTFIVGVILVGLLLLLVLLSLILDEVPHAHDDER